MKDTNFLSMSTYIRVQEKSLLDRASLERIIDAPSTQEALRMISQSTGYDFAALGRPEDYETVVRAELRDTYRMAFDIASTTPALPEITGCKYDYHNVKVALKMKYLGEMDKAIAGNAPYIAVTPVDPIQIAKVVEKFDSKANFPQNILDAIVAGMQSYEREENPQDIDLALDKLQYVHMLALAEQLENEFILGYVRSAIDFYNLKALVRVKSMQKGTAFLSECLAEGGNTDPAFFSGNYAKSGGALSLAFMFKDYGEEMKLGMESFEKSGNYSELERLLDNYLIDYVKNAKRVSFGPEILFAYLVSKENEIRQIRIVVACKQNQISPEILKERLRDNYV